MKRPEPTKSMRQVKFECSEEFRQRLNEEKIRRNLTLQQLAIRALERYLEIPESVHRRIDEKVAESDEPAWFWSLLLGSKELRAVLNRAAHPGSALTPARSHLAVQLRNVLELIEANRDLFPIEYLRLLEQSLVLDLKYYRSARIGTEHPRELVGAKKGPGAKGDG